MNINREKKTIIYLVGIVVFIAICQYYYYQDASEKITANSLGNGYILEESKYLFGGVWFKKDRINITPEGFYIEERSLVWGTESFMIPYSKVKKVVLKKGYSTNEMVVVSEGGLLSKTNRFYINSNDNFNFITTVVRGFCNNQFILAKQESLFNRLKRTTQTRKIVKQERNTVTGQIRTTYSDGTVVITDGKSKDGTTSE